MTDLTTVMRAGRGLLLAEFREPAVTAWNRLEARPRAHDFGRSLRAEVRDATWMLCRQWQLGELVATDGGSPIDVRLETRTTAVDRVRVGAGPTAAYDDTLPLEAAIEREPVPWTHALRVQAAQYFLRLHPAALRAKYLPRYVDAFRFAAGGDAALGGQVDGRNLWVATRRVAFDGELLLAALEAGTFATDVPVDAGDAAALQPAIDGIRGWMGRLFVQPPAGAGAAWDPTRLCYGAAVEAPAASGGRIVLDASHYDSGRLDWHAFDAVPGATLPEESRGAPEAGDGGRAAATEEALSFLPVPAAFRGMPLPRFWAMEEGQVNFGALEAKTTDHLLVVLAELGLVYGNDWFVVPYRMPVNALCEVRRLVVTDVFGERTLVRPASARDPGGAQRWSLFALAEQGTDGGADGRAGVLFVPPTVAATLEGAPLERVQWVRDEMANMAWGIEEVIPDATGRGIDGYAAADRSGIAPEPIAGSPAPVRYVLGTTVPENWIPFLPVQRGTRRQDVAFQRGAMPRLGDPPRDVVRAKGVMLTEAPLPWFVNEEEVSVAGTIVTRTWQRARWYDGRVVLWIGRRRETGRGAGSSSLRFDQVLPTDAG